MFAKDVLQIIFDKINSVLVVGRSIYNDNSF